MAYMYGYSVGTIDIGGHESGIATEISVSYDGDMQAQYGGDYRAPLALELGNQSGEIRCSTVRFDVENDPLDNTYVDVTLGLGSNSGGLAGTIEGCKVGSMEVTSSQNAYIATNFTLAIGSAIASTAQKSGNWPSW